MFKSNHRIFYIGAIFILLKLTPFCRVNHEEVFYYSRHLVQMTFSQKIHLKFIKSNRIIVFFVYFLTFVNLRALNYNNLKFIYLYHFVEHEKLHQSTLLVFILSLQKKKIMSTIVIIWNTQK
jgi:hypothetical protein